MDADHHSSSRAIARKLVFYVQLAQRPELLAAHVADLIQRDHGHTREEVLVAVDWALDQADLRELIRQPHDDEVLRGYLAAVVAHLER